MALMTVSSSGTAENIQLAISAGNLPKSPVFVLLDAPQKPAFDVRILTGSIANRAQVLEHIRQMLAKGLPGSNHIRVEAQKTDVDVQKLGGIQTEILDAALIETDKGTVILDQAIRVNDSPWTVVLSSADEKLKAAAVVARSLEMLGYPASQAFLLEEIYAEASASQRAAIGPALAQAYHVMERDDWALELGLELLSASGLQSKETMHEMQTAASIVFAITGRASEFASTIHEVSGFITKLSPSWQKSFAHAMLQSQDLARWHDYYTVSRHSFNEFDEMLECLNTEDQDICESNLENSKTELGQLWYQTMLISAKSPAPEHLELAKKADRIGAPNLGMKLWAAILSTGLTAEASQGAWINMAQYARRAQQTRTFLHLMADYEYHQAPYANELYAEAVSGWRSLDYRAEIAHSCVSRASTAGDESVDLLQLAAELYISMGDAENTAIVYAKLSRIYEERGQADTASQYLNMARSFARETHQKEVLTAIEGEINNASE